MGERGPRLIQSFGRALDSFNLFARLRRKEDERKAFAAANSCLEASLQLLAERNRQLEESEMRFRLTLKNAPIGLAVVALDGRFVSVNDALCQIVGYGEAELLQMSFVDISHPDDLRRDLDLVQELMVRKRDNYRMEKRYLHKHGHSVTVQLDVSLLRNDSGAPVHFISQIQDITERHRARNDLLRLASEVEDLYDNAPCGYHSLDENGVFLRVNQTELQWFGYRRDELIGKKTVADLVDDEGKVRFRETFARFKAEGCIIGVEYRAVRKDGSTFPILLNSTLVTSPDGKYRHSRGTIFDITERKQLEQVFERQARTDVLTGLPNRRHFMEQAAQEVARVRRCGGHVSVLMLDVDHFKAVNDSYGHRIGDMVLRETAAIASRAMRQIDTVCRIGGEEFSVLLPETDRPQAIRVAERLREAIASTPIRIPDAGLVHITASLGVAVCNQHDADLDVLLNRADIGLYAAKGGGRNRVCLHEEPEVAGL